MTREQFNALVNADIRRLIKKAELELKAERNQDIIARCLTAYKAYTSLQSIDDNEAGDIDAIDLTDHDHDEFDRLKNHEIRGIK